jgi:hypothetical protein
MKSSSGSRSTTRITAATAASRASWRRSASAGTRTDSRAASAATVGCARAFNTKATDAAFG